MSNRDVIMKAIETLGEGYFDDIFKATGIDKAVLGRTLRRMYYRGEIHRVWNKRKDAPCHLDYSGYSEKMQFLYSVKK